MKCPTMANPIRRIHDTVFKTKWGRPAMVLEALRGHKTLVQLSSEFGIHSQMITDCKRQVLEAMPTAFEPGIGKPTLSVEQREQIEAPLFQQIGQLKVENDFHKKITDELSNDRRKLIEPGYAHLSISQQCDLLGIPRSCFYYHPVGKSARNLALWVSVCWHEVINAVGFGAVSCVVKQGYFIFA